MFWQFLDYQKRIAETPLTLTNAGFETGDLTGWTVESGTATVSDGDAALGVGAAEGNWSFNPTASDVIIYQDVDVSSYSAEIDIAGAVCTVRRQILSDEYDHSASYISCLDGSGVSVDLTADRAHEKFRLKRTSNGAWTTVRDHFYVPTGTRTIRVHFRSELGAIGSVNQALIDDVLVYLSFDALYHCNRLIPVTNGGFESGDDTGWTQDPVNTWKIVTGNTYGDAGPPEGSYYAFPDNLSAYTLLYQNLDVSEWSGPIEDGSISIIVGAEILGVVSDRGRFETEQFDSGSNLLLAENSVWFSPSSFRFDTFELTVDSNLDNFNLGLRADLEGAGSVNQAYFDDVLAYARFNQQYRTL